MATTMEQTPNNDSSQTFEAESSRETEVRQQTLDAVANYAAWCAIIYETPHCIRSDN